jgi:kynureninase
MDVVESLVLEIRLLKAEIDKNEQLILLSPRHAALKSGIVVFKHRTVANEVLYKYLQDNGVVCHARRRHTVFRIFIILPGKWIRRWVGFLLW